MGGAVATELLADPFFAGDGQRARWQQMRHRVATETDGSARMPANPCPAGR